MLAYMVRKQTAVLWGVWFSETMRPHARTHARTHAHMQTTACLTCRPRDELNAGEEEEGRGEEACEEDGAHGHLPAVAPGVELVAVICGCGWG